MLMTDGSSALRDALDARHVAVFGASATPGKWGYNVAEFLLAGGYAGKLSLVNPRGGSVFGLPLVSASEAAGADLAVICTPGAAVPSILRQCGDLGIPTAIVQSGGFAESGDRALADELQASATESGVRVIGPNTYGIYVSSNALNVTNIDQWTPGNVSIITQSGGVAQHIARRLEQLGSGVDVLLALGNKLDIDFADGLAVLAERPSTHGILMYLERLDEGERFLEQLERVAKVLPVTVLIGGRTPEGRSATQTHTGSMINDWARVRGLVASAGANVVESLQLAAASAASSRRRPPATIRKVLILLDGGGHSALLADAISKAGYELPRLDAATGARLKAIGGPRTTPNNPFDIQSAGDRDPEIYARMFEAVADDPSWDAIVLGTMFGGWTLFGEDLRQPELDGARRLVELAARHEVPVVVHTLYATERGPALELFRSGGLPYVEWPDEAVAALRSLGPVAVASDPAADAGAHAADGDDALADLTERVVGALEGRGIPTYLGDRISRRDLPVADAGPWALRLDGFAHKTRHGAIKVGLGGPELEGAFDELSAIARRSGIAPHVRIAPVIAIEQELIVTFWRDAKEGDGCLIGAGGVQVEQEGDVAIGRLPTTREQVAEILGKSRAGRRVLASPRADAFCTVVVQLSQAFIADLPDLRELECNPVTIGPTGVAVLDALPAAHAEHVN
jgi:acetyltransferase